MGEPPAAAIITHVKAGFFDEPDEWAGISHVLEHMFFKGTPTRGVGQIAKETRGSGGWLNAGTGYDHTVYQAVVPADQWALGLKIQADALQHPLLDEGELERELQVIIEEARRKRDTPGAVAYESMHRLLFDRHRIRRWRIGEPERLAGFRRRDVWEYYRTRYLPERTILAIVGGVDPAAVLNLVREEYGSWAAGAGAVPRGPEEPWHREVRAETLRGDIALGELVLGWRTEPAPTPEAGARR